MPSLHLDIARDFAAEIADITSATESGRKIYYWAFIATITTLIITVIFFVIVRVLVIVVFLCN